MNTSISDISQKILFVDDEKLLLEGIKRQLRRQFELSVAESAEAALVLIADQGPFAVVVSDYNMPHINGIDFLNAVYRQHPQTVLVMLTGRADLDIAIQALHDAHISRFISKPCPKEVLLETLNDGLEQYRLRIAEQILQQQLQQANQELGSLNNRLETRVAEKTRALQLQYRHVAHMAQLDNSKAVVDALITAVRELAPQHNISLWLCPHANKQFSCHYPSGHKQPDFDISRCRSSLLDELSRKKQAWRYTPAYQTALGAFERSLFNGQPWMSLPLQSKQNLIGILNLAGENIDYPTGVLEALTGVVNVSATALQSHWHHEAFENAQDAIITALAKLAEYRDPETGSHLLRLKKYCSLMCLALAKTDEYKDIVTPEFAEDLVRSSPLHDIGKVGIPDAILKKPGRFTDDEFEVMKNHTRIGGDVLAAIYDQYPSQNFIKCGMDIAYGHHEKWDGSGYPLGLQGKSIPLPARILALVDVYDALTCRRVYKVPFTREQTKNIISEGSGSHFDPDMVTTFLTIEPDFHHIAEQFADC